LDVFLIYIQLFHINSLKNCRPICRISRTFPASWRVGLSATIFFTSPKGESKKYFRFNP